MEFRCILFWDTSESDILVESRCIRNVWFLEHTSEMPELGPFRCIITLVSVGDTSGLRIRFPSRCTWVQILIKYTSGWANIGHFRCIANFHHIEIHRNSTIHTNPDVSKSSIHRKPKFSSNPDVSPTETRAIIHRKGPESGISDVCSKNHILQIHQDSTRISDSDVS